jgi:S1-C subfamily serine protease
MSANEPRDPHQAADGAPLWRPEVGADEPAKVPGETPESASTVPTSYPAVPAPPPSPWASPATAWTTPPPPPGERPGYPTPGYGWPGYGAPQFGVPQAPYQPWATPLLPPAPVSGPPKQHSAARRLGVLMVAVAMLSASLSAVGTYVAVSLAAKPAAAVTASTTQTGDAQLISLTQTDAIIRVANAVKPSVVTITSDAASGVSPFAVPSTGVGSGFIVSADGLILTNNHVIKGAATLMVTLDDTRQLAATVVTTDATHDLALIKVDATGLTAVTLGDSSTIQVGQLAIAIGSPLGTFTDSVTQGIVSGTDRSITVGDQASRSEENLSGLIQTDAAINPGNSGGPLLDANGSVVGIITASASNAQDMGFAIPINQAKQMIAQATK